MEENTMKRTTVVVIAVVTLCLLVLAVPAVADREPARLLNAEGACCMPGGSCVYPVDQVGCEVAGGVYMGHGSVCGAGTCEGVFPTGGVTEPLTALASVLPALAVAAAVAAGAAGAVALKRRACTPGA